jgi:ribosomal 30S subunit maturation factor RimM
VAVFPLVEHPGSVFVPKAQLYVVDEDRKVLAGPLVLARRRAYHREWLLGFEGITSRAAVEGWRDQLVAIDDDADDADG